MLSRFAEVWQRPLFMADRKPVAVAEAGDDTGNGGDDQNGDNGGDDGGDDGGDNGLPPVSVPPLPSTQVEPVDEVLTLAQAIVQCTLDGISQINLKAWNQCIKDYTH